MSDHKGNIQSAAPMKVEGGAFVCRQGAGEEETTCCRRCFYGLDSRHDLPDFIEISLSLVPKSPRLKLSPRGAIWPLTGIE